MINIPSMVSFVINIPDMKCSRTKMQQNQNAEKRYKNLILDTCTHTTSIFSSAAGQSRICLKYLNCIKSSKNKGKKNIKL